MLIDEALRADRVVLSVMGPHAGETAEVIFSRKTEDIVACGRTYWLCCSPAARPDRVQAFAPSFVIFLEASTANGARPTTSSERVSEISSDRELWSAVDARVGPITGRLARGAYAFTFSELDTTVSTSLDLWMYAVGESPIRFKLGASTLLAGHKDTSTCLFRMKSRFRRILAIARLADPIAVWVR